MQTVGNKSQNPQVSVNPEAVLSCFNMRKYRYVIYIKIKQYFFIYYFILLDIHYIFYV